MRYFLKNDYYNTDGSVIEKGTEYYLVNEVRVGLSGYTKYFRQKGGEDILPYSIGTDLLRAEK